MQKAPLAAASLVLAVLLLSTFAAAQGSETLGSVKQRYLNQKVVLTGDVADDLATQPVLMEWWSGSEVDGRYDADMERYLPATYKGQTATVIAIQLNDLEKQHKVNALGDPVSPDSTVNPYFDLVVRFDGGQIAMTTGYPSTISSEIKLASEQNAVAQEMATRLPGVVGKSLLACGITDLYQPDATLEELLGASRILKQIPASDIPYLVPLTIAAAKYNEAANAVILKVKLPNSREALSIASGDQLTDSDESFIERISGGLLSEIPKYLTSQEVAAIKNKSIFRGMSRNALYYSMGLPKTENDWGSGGKQFVYTESLMVYLNNQSKVVDWQSLGN